jgi:hypothetical protein
LFDAPESRVSEPFFIDEDFEQPSSWRTCRSVSRIVAAESSATWSGGTRERRRGSSGDGPESTPLPDGLQEAFHS